MLAVLRTSSNLTHVPIVKLFGLIVLLLLVFASSATAEGPKEQLQNTIDGIIKVLKTIRTPADISRNRNSIRQLLLTRFDFVAMAQRSLGNRWNDLKDNEQEFVSVFTDFVEHGYMSTLGSYRGEKVVYDGARVNGESAEVDTRVVGGEGSPIKIDYKSISQVNSGWSTTRLSMTSASLAIIGLSSREFFARLHWTNYFRACERR